MLVEEEDIGATLEKSVSGRETSKTTTDYDDLCHGDMYRMTRNRARGAVSEVGA